MQSCSPTLSRQWPSTSQYAHPLRMPTGSDIDSIGLVFLQPVTAATIGNISYTGVPSNEVSVQACIKLHHAFEGLYDYHSAVYMLLHDSYMLLHDREGLQLHSLYGGFYSFFWSISVVQVALHMPLMT